MIQFAIVGIILLAPVFAKQTNICAQDENSSACGSSLLSHTSDSESEGSDHSDDLSYEVSSRTMTPEAVHPSLVCHFLGPPLTERRRMPENSPIQEEEEEDFVPPENYEHALEMTLKVGFKRLRKAMLSSESDFWSEAILKGALQYQNVTVSPWDKHPNAIGNPLDAPSSQKSSMVGAQQETSYLMPGSKLLNPKMAYEEATLTSYTSSGFSIDKVTSTPDVPFGQSFVAKTRLVVQRLDDEQCRLTCSVETDFPKGAPLGMAGSIRNGMKRGTLKVFTKMGDMIQQCAVLYGQPVQ